MSGLKSRNEIRAQIDSLKNVTKNFAYLYETNGAETFKEQSIHAQAGVEWLEWVLGKRQPETQISTIHTESGDVTTFTERG